jgi:alpha 1,2-mannosyltransferase
MEVNPQELHNAVDEMFRTNNAIPKYQKGKSIVTSIYSKEFVTGFVLLKELERYAVSLPVEVFYRENELTPEQINILLKCKLKLSIKKIKGNAKDFITQYGSIAGWSTKVYALLESDYCENLWIDADNFPIGNPEELFNDIEYVNKGSLFWRDVMSPDRANRYHDNAVMWPIFKVTPNDAEPFETGQMLINKLKCWQQMLLVKHYADNCEIYYNFGGDAETFRMAWQHYYLRNVGIIWHINAQSDSNTSYGFMPYGCFHKGVPNQFSKWGGGTVMCQRDRNGYELFNHRNINKFKLNDNIFNQDITNEQFYHQHIETLKELLSKEK